ncbi:MAG: TIGR00269 family protein [Candidatus Helarchaeota archaeon]
MKTRCKGLKSTCGKEATVYLGYIRRGFCDEHFIIYEIKRMSRTIKRYNMIKATKDTIFVALSGGKDSSALLDMLISYYNQIEEKYRPKIEGIHINLGIDINSFSDKSQNIVKKLCKRLNVPLHIIDLKKIYGHNLLEIKKSNQLRSKKICSICGTIKRYLLNKYSMELGATKIATGHLLDDEVALLMKNLIFGSIESLTRMSANLETIKEYNLLAKIKPLYEISEYETLNYVQIKNLPYISEKCPFTNLKSKRMKNVMLDLEKEYPNARYSLLRNFNKYYRTIFKTQNNLDTKTISKCKKCGQPTTMKICSFCRIMEKL